PGHGGVEATADLFLLGRELGLVTFVFCDLLSGPDDLPLDQFAVLVRELGLRRRQALVQVPIFQRAIPVRLELFDLLVDLVEDDSDPIEVLLGLLPLAFRAGKLTDLIWNGGKDKNAADSCQVSLIFDNSDRQIPLEADEVKLTRYIGLSPSVEGGYNSYFYINDRKSSLSEFDSLLAHARISAEGYNLVQQGDIQRIVSMSSVERRRILDNIAGITKFDDDIGQAEGKRKETEDNLERIRIILDEIDKQIKQLEADRDGALKYRDLNEKLTTAKAQLAYKNRELIERQIVGTREQIAKHEGDKA